MPITPKEITIENIIIRSFCIQRDENDVYHFEARYYYIDDNGVELKRLGYHLWRASATWEELDQKRQKSVNRLRKFMRKAIFEEEGMRT